MGAPRRVHQVMAALYRRMHGDGLRYNIGGSWSANYNTPHTLTWSFVPDGTMIPASGSDIPEEQTSPSTLFATMDEKFGGNRAQWIGYIEGCFNRWSDLTAPRNRTRSSSRWGATQASK